MIDVLEDSMEVEAKFATEGSRKQFFSPCARREPRYTSLPFDMSLRF